MCPSLLSLLQHLKTVELKPGLLGLLTLNAVFEMFEMAQLHAQIEVWSDQARYAGRAARTDGPTAGLTDGHWRVGRQLGAPLQAPSLPQG